MIIKVCQKTVFMCLQYTYVSFHFVELAYLDCAYHFLLQYMDNGSSLSTNFTKHDLASLLLDETNSENGKLMKHCEKHNIRKINIRCLSELLKVNTSLSCSSNEVLPPFSWATYFNADCTFSSCKFQNASQSSPSPQLISVRNFLIERMILLDKSLYEARDSYKGRLKCYLFTYVHLSLIYNIYIYL